MKKKLLIYAHYYIPDVASTGQILRELAEGMRYDFDITVLCVVPSYTGIISPEYQEKKIYREDTSATRPSAGVQQILQEVPHQEHSGIFLWCKESNKRAKGTFRLCFYHLTASIDGWASGCVWEKETEDC